MLVYSLFGGLSFGGKKKVEEAAPAVPAKDTDVAEVSCQCGYLHFLPRPLN